MQTSKIKKSSFHLFNRGQFSSMFIGLGLIAICFEASASTEHIRKSSNSIDTYSCEMRGHLTTTEYTQEPWETSEVWVDFSKSSSFPLNTTKIAYLGPQISKGTQQASAFSLTLRPHARFMINAELSDSDGVSIASVSFLEGSEKFKISASMGSDQYDINSFTLDCRLIVK